MDRRSFLISSAAALSASSSVFGAASDTVRVAVVGIGGRARDHIAGLMREQNVEIVAICDPDDSHLDKGQKQIAAANQKAPQNYRDVRKLLEDKSIDAITIATPEPLALADGHLGLPGGQGRVRGEALLAQCVRGQADCGGGAQVQPHRAARQPDPLVGGGAGGRAEDARGPDRRRLPGARAVLQMARHHRPHAGFGRAAREWITTCGPVPRPSATSP